MSEKSEKKFFFTYECQYEIYSHPAIFFFHFSIFTRFFCAEHNFFMQMYAKTIGLYLVFPHTAEKNI